MKNNIKCISIILFKIIIAIAASNFMIGYYRKLNQ